MLHPAKEPPVGTLIAESIPIRDDLHAGRPAARRPFSERCSGIVVLQSGSSLARPWRSDGERPRTRSAGNLLGPTETSELPLESGNDLLAPREITSTQS